MAKKVRARPVSGRAPFAVTEKMRASVRDMREAGVSTPDIAKKLGVSTRVVKLHFADIIDHFAPKKVLPPVTLAVAAQALSAADLTDLARTYSAAALGVLSEIAADGKADARVRMLAAEKVLSWAYGKPLGIGSMKPSGAVPAETKPEKLGKKEQLVRDAHNPDAESPLGRLMAARMGAKPN